MNIAIISRTVELAGDEVSAAAAAIQQQIVSHFSQIWHINAVVAAFDSYAPLGYAPIFIDSTISAPSGYTGYHTTNAGNPFAIVQYGPTWTLTASHEAMEMLVDPDGMKTIPGISPADGTSPVNFICEICDPCQDPAYSYKIDGFAVSDFCTPSYFDANAGGSQLSWTGAVKAPLAVLPGGAQLWVTPSNEVYQRINIGDNISIGDLGIYQPGPLGRREFARTNRGSYPGLSDAGGSHQRHEYEVARGLARHAGQKGIEVYEEARRSRLVQAEESTMIDTSVRD